MTDLKAAIDAYARGTKDEFIEAIANLDIGSLNYLSAFIDGFKRGQKEK